MIPFYLYVGFPTVIGLMITIGLRLSLGPLRSDAATVLRSYRLSWTHIGFAGVAVVLTAGDPISALACRFAHAGLVLSAAFAILDVFLIVVWYFGRAKELQRWALARPLGWVALRISAHLALAGQFLWCTMLCTV